MKIKNPACEIEKLLNFAFRKNLITAIDMIPIRNSLLDLLGIRTPFEGDFQEELEITLGEILEDLLDFAVEQSVIEEDNITNRDLFDTRIMGLLTPAASVVAREFELLERENGIKSATDFFYDLCISVNYIRWDRILKNQHWTQETDYGDLEITINLSKPEKDPKEIALAKKVKSTGYPKCVLCIENAGYAGNINHPARQNLRLIPLRLNGSDWFFQYSPYVYYNEHCIIIKDRHIPMEISHDTFRDFFDFLDRFPHYFIGSNADLPIVGGSILNHNHYQGGRHIMPMEKAKCKSFFTDSKQDGLEISILNWPMSVIRLTSYDRAKLYKAACRILDKWRKYSDPDADVFAFTGEEKHNTVTPIGRKRNGKYEFDLVLRNNRTSSKHPLGIFHPHENLHHIKKENIGLIEVMGLAILPGRLKEEMKLISEILEGNTIDYSDLVKENGKLESHRFWIEQLKLKYGIHNDSQQTSEILKKEIALKFMNVLEDSGVFKNNVHGELCFEKFLKECGFEKI